MRGKPNQVAAAVTGIILALLLAESAHAGVGRNISRWGREQLEEIWLVAIGLGFLFCFTQKRASIWGIYIAATVVSGIYVWNPEAIARISREIGNNL